MTPSENFFEQLKSIIFWLVFFGCLLVFVDNAKAEDEVILANVIQSAPYYGEKGQEYIEQCDARSTPSRKCTWVGKPAEYFATTFTTGMEQITILTKSQFPHDIWFEITRNCDSGSCKYKRAILSQYQSPETLAIDEILTSEQRRYQNNPRRMY